MGLFFNWDRPGPGVMKDEQPKNEFERFLIPIKRNFGGFVLSNLLCLMSAIPLIAVLFIISGLFSSLFTVNSSDEIQIIFDIILRTFVSIIFISFWGAGPVTAGITNVMRKYAKGEHVFIFSDFKDGIKQNFRQSFAVLLIDLAESVIIAVVIPLYLNMRNGIFFLAILLGIMFLYTLMHFYIYPLMVSYKMKLKDIYYYSLMLSAGHLLPSIAVFAAMAAVNFVIMQIVLNSGAYTVITFVAFIMLEIFILSGLWVYLINYTVKSKISVNKMRR